ncbi:MAG: LysR family transcriptional regulator [Neomegalonema sp.]|nr:LysR family transcriptional regulator [Neomegalonema sp.]
MSNRSVATPGDRLELLETFIRIADTGGIGAAARDLGATQPTVTRRLQQLEAMMGVKLVERGGQGLSLTPSGAALLPEAREVTRRWRGLQELFEEEDVEIAGRVRIVAAREIGVALLPPLLASFMRDHPEVRLESRFTDGAVDLAADGADFWVREGKGSSDGASVREIGKVRRALCAAPMLAEKLGAERGVAIQRCEPLALAGAPLLARHSTFSTSVKFKGRESETLDVEFDRVASLDSDDAILDLALAERGVALLPTWRIAPLVRDKVLTRIATDWAEDDTPVSVLWRAEQFRNAAASALMARIQEELPKALEAS